VAQGKGFEFKPQYHKKKKSWILSWTPTNSTHKWGSVWHFHTFVEHLQPPFLSLPCTLSTPWYSGFYFQVNFFFTSYVRQNTQPRPSASGFFTSHISPLSSHFDVNCRIPFFMGVWYSMCTDNTFFLFACGCTTQYPVHFALVILEIGSQELFPWTGFELTSSQSKPPK
jgi:hypothetical protein